MADTDYDAPRVREGAATAPPVLEELIGYRAQSRSSDTDESVRTAIGEANFLDRLSSDEPGQPGLVQQADEFTCSRCFLIVHRRLLARTLRSRPICRDCS